MPEIEFLNIFQGIATMVASDPHIAVARVVLIALESPSSIGGSRERLSHSS